MTTPPKGSVTYRDELKMPNLATPELDKFAQNPLNSPQAQAVPDLWEKTPFRVLGKGKSPRGWGVEI